LRAIGSLISSIFDLKKPLLLEAFLYLDYGMRYSYKVVFPNAQSLLEVTDNKDVFLLADKVDKLLKTAFNAIK
tara:strand:+ start:466 stop:684 length:219 start_codon:yes stop_codon:yes gene_type:complete